MNKFLLLLSLCLQFTLSSFGPFSTQAPPYKFTQNPLSTPSSIWGKSVAPFETNSWYQNLALGEGYNPINLLPYIISRDSMTNGIGVGVPPETKISSGSVVETPYSPSWYVSIKESKLSAPQFDSPQKLSVTLMMKYLNATRDGSMTVPLVRGMGMFTARFQKMTPKLVSVASILTITLSDGTELNPGDNFTNSDSVIVALDNGDFWVIYISDTTLEFTTSNNSIYAVTQPANPLNLRLGYLAKDKTKKAILDTYKSNIPSRVAVDYTINQDNTATITFTYSLLSLEDYQPINAGQVFMYALPHHKKTLVTPTTQDIKINTIKGQMIAITDSVWTLKQTLTTTLWDTPNGFIDQTIKEKLYEEIRKDIGYMPTTNSHPYQFGKMVTRMARVALIARSLNETASARIVAQNIITALKPWLQDKNPNPLRFDATWGGLVTQASLSDQKAEYGSGVYNDHHFHYGYHVYAAAVAGLIVPQFLTNYTEQLLTYVRDYANPSVQDTYFVVTRHKDWFCGHSWASGLVEFGQNRNQESFSEALHSYYAVALLGKSMKDNNTYNFGRLLLATEMTSAKTYWTIDDPTAADAIYPSEFGNNRMVGVLWDLKADYTTWFGGRIEYIHGIQMIPFTPITEEYLTKDYVTNEYKVMEKSRPDTTGEWYSYKLMDEAVINTSGAYQKLMISSIQDWGGNSMTNALWWMATRPKQSQVVNDSYDE